MVVLAPLTRVLGLQHVCAVAIVYNLIYLSNNVTNRFANDLLVIYAEQKVDWMALSRGAKVTTMMDLVVEQTATLMEVTWMVQQEPCLQWLTHWVTHHLNDWY